MEIHGVGVVTNNHPDGKSVVTYEQIGQKPGNGYIIEWEKLRIEPVEAL